MGSLQSADDEPKLNESTLGMYTVVGERKTSPFTFLRYFFQHQITFNCTFTVNARVSTSVPIESLNKKK